MASYSEIWEPFLNLFTTGQVNTLLLAWLPTKLDGLLPGIMAVDMFLTTVIASGFTAFFAFVYAFISNPKPKEVERQAITVQIEPYSDGAYGDHYVSPFYEAISWLISQQTKALEKGAFVVVPTKAKKSDYDSDDDDDDCAPPNFNILPEKDQSIIIEHKDRKFRVTYNLPDGSESNDNNNNKDEGSDSSYHRGGSRGTPMKNLPSIYLSAMDDYTITVDSVTDFINQVTRAFLETQRKQRVRSRYERKWGYWYNVQNLTMHRSLNSVALDMKHETLLEEELNTFVNDKAFYDRIGMPYRRGILLFGKPGTGKTSLINAISCHLFRDIYYINLKSISDDDELSAAFSSVPANQIIVLEDVDAQSRVLHKRTSGLDAGLLAIMDDMPGPSMPGMGSGGSGMGGRFSLSTFLGCLDGNILNEGNIIIMTTNHADHLDPAVIRPGRMDVKLDLGYCTHYQIQKMYRSVVEDEKAEFPASVLQSIPEYLLPPCEVMTTMVLYRRKRDLIPEKIYELVAKCESRLLEDAENEKRMMVEWESRLQLAKEKKEKLDRARKREEAKLKREEEQAERDAEEAEKKEIEEAEKKRKELEEEAAKQAKENEEKLKAERSGDGTKVEEKKEENTESTEPKPAENAEKEEKEEKKDSATEPTAEPTTAEPTTAEPTGAEPAAEPAKESTAIASPVEPVTPEETAATKNSTSDDDTDSDGEKTETETEEATITLKTEVIETVTTNVSVTA